METHPTAEMHFQSKVIAHENAYTNIFSPSNRLLRCPGYRYQVLALALLTPITTAAMNRQAIECTKFEEPIRRLESYDSVAAKHSPSPFILERKVARRGKWEIYSTIDPLTEHISQHTKIKAHATIGRRRKP